jgi:hypothetical protein
MAMVAVRGMWVMMMVVMMHGELPGRDKVKI